ncbi:hypothetical protein JHK85_007532 [Glycine max]|nr:hypothetical protein JHK85_007532 [Glycine max]
MVNGKNNNNNNNNVSMSPRQSNFGGFDEESGGGVRVNGGAGVGGYPGPANAGIFSPVAAKKKGGESGGGGKDLHMFVWSSSASPVSEGGIHVFRGGGGDYGSDQLPVGGVAHQKDYDEFGHDEFSFGNRTVANGVDKEGPVLSKLGSSSTAELRPKAQDGMLLCQQLAMAKVAIMVPAVCNYYYTTTTT